MFEINFILLSLFPWPLDEEKAVREVGKGITGCFLTFFLQFIGNFVESKGKRDDFHHDLNISVAFDVLFQRIIPELKQRG